MINQALISHDGEESKGGEFSSDDETSNSLPESEVLERAEFLLINRIECKILKISMVAGILCVSQDKVSI